MAKGTGPLAAIDCGTNSTRLLIVGREGETLVRLMRITRLGQGVDANHKLEHEAVDRTLDALATFRAEMDRFAVAGARMAATSAVRDADNGQEFLEAAADVVGVRAELLSGVEEGRLAYAGATADLEPAASGVVVVDIGGGSTELIADVDGRVAAVSMDIGCVRLTERYLRHDPPVADEVATTRRAIAEELGRAEQLLAPLRNQAPDRRLVGLAGTVSTLASLEQQLAAYDRDRIHHAVLGYDAVVHWAATLAAEPSSSRAARAGMVTGREDVIVGGALVLQEVMARFGFGECLVSESDILDGLAASLQA